MGKLKILYVIWEQDLSDNEEDIIGVADSVEEVERMILKYYGECKIISNRKIEESGIEFIRRMEVNDWNADKYEVLLTIRYFGLNDI
jgi:hypothetical protein